MLEGSEQGQRYLVTMDVVASSREKAVQIAQEEASRIGLSITAVEECITRSQSRARAGIVKVYGKSYFGSDT